MNRYFYLIALLLYCLGATAQDYQVLVEKLSTEQGLSDRFVRSIFQDSRGYMWFGTNNGLNRYDGNRVQVFDVSNSKVASEPIWHLFEDNNEHLWLFYCTHPDMLENLSNIHVVDVHTLELKTVEEYLGEVLPFETGMVREVCYDKKAKTLYFATEQGEVWTYGYDEGFQQIFQQEEHLPVESLRVGERYLWLYFYGELMALDRNGKPIYRASLDPGLQAPLPKDMYQLTIGIDSSSIWFQVSLGVKYYWEPRIGKLIQKPYFSNKEDTTRGISGLHRFSETGCYLQYSALDVKLYAPDSEVIYHASYPKYTQQVSGVYVDQQGNVWYSVLAEGITKISHQKKRFATYLQGCSIRSIVANGKDSALTVSSYQGRYACQRYRLHEASVKSQPLSDLPNTVLYDSPTRKKIIGNYYSDLIVLDKTAQKTERIYRSHPDVLNWQTGSYETIFRDVWALHETSDTTLWIGTDKGLRILPAGGDSLLLYFPMGDTRNLLQSVVNDFHQNKDGLWIAASTGLYCWKEEEATWWHYHSGQEEPFQLPFDDLVHIHEDQKGMFCLATRGGGWLRFDPQTGRCEQWTTTEGLSNNFTNATLEDDYGYFWVSSNQGLMRIDVLNNDIQTFLPSNGLPHEEFNREAAYKSNDGWLYFGGLNGFVELHPADFVHTPTTNYPSLNVTNYRFFSQKEGGLVNGTERFKKEGSIDLAYNDRSFEITIALMDYHANVRKRYAYQLLGADNQWTYTNKATIRIGGLRAGQYHLAVKAELSDGSWSPVLLSIPVLVRAPFYMQWPFLVGLVAFLLFLGWAYTRWRTQRLYAMQQLLEEEVTKRTQTIEEQANALRELDELKSRFFANISHELRTPLTLILGPVEQALNASKGYTEEQTERLLRLIQRNGIRLKSLIEQILDLSRLEANEVALEERPYVVVDLLEQLWSNFEWQAQHQGVAWQLEQDVPMDLQAWVDVDKVEKILNNLLSNALKHTPEGGRVVMTTQWNTELTTLQVVVRDTGEGMAPEELPHIFERFYQASSGKSMGGTGIGLALSQELTTLMQGALTVESTLGKGSAFTLQLPLRIIEGQALDVLPTKELEATSTTSLKGTVLVVEDNTDLRLHLSDLLSAHYQVLTAEHGKIALDLFKESKASIDLILSDVTMPEMDGFELLEQLRALPPKEQVPVILLTAQTAQRDRLRALRIGVNDYLTKPFSQQELLARIDNLLTHHEQRRTWQATSIKALADGETDGATTNGGEVSVPKALEVESDAWLERLETIATREVGNSQFNIAQLAYDLHLSERQLRRKIKTKTGMTPNQYFRCIKLEIARQHLETRRYETVAEVAYKVGFSNAHYFTKIYLAQYGKKPIEYLR